MIRNERAFNGFCSLRHQFVCEGKQEASNFIYESLRCLRATRVMWHAENKKQNNNKRSSSLLCCVLLVPEFQFRFQQMRISIKFSQNSLHVETLKSHGEKVFCATSERAEREHFCFTPSWKFGRKKIVLKYYKTRNAIKVSFYNKTTVFKLGQSTEN